MCRRRGPAAASADFYTVKVNLPTGRHNNAVGHGTWVPTCIEGRADPDMHEHQRAEDELLPLSGVGGKSQAHPV